MTLLVHYDLSDAQYNSILSDATTQPPQLVGVLVAGRGGNTVYVTGDNDSYFVSDGQWAGLRQAGLDFVLYAGL